MDFVLGNNEIPMVYLNKVKELCALPLSNHKYNHVLPVSSHAIEYITQTNYVKYWFSFYD